MLQAQTYVYGKEVLAVLGIPILCFYCRRRHRWFRVSCLFRCHFIQFFMSLPYTASLYHVYANHYMPQLPSLLNASGGYFMLSYAASSICEECFALYFILLYANVLV